MTETNEPMATGSTVGGAGTLSISDLESHALEAADDERVRWVTRRLPARLEDRANWWLHLLLVVKHGLHKRPQAGEQWARLYVWAVSHATETGAFTADESTIKIASFVAELRHGELGADVADGLPSADAIVKACLARIPFSLDAVPDATNLQLLDIDTMRRSRLAKNLVNVAAAFRDHVQDSDVAAELHGWIKALPRLV